jgi:hypothetical protein
MIDDTVLFVNPKQRETLSRIPGISSALKRKLAQPTGTFPLPEIVLMMEKMSLASQDDIPDGLVVMSELAQQIHDEIRRLAETHGASAAPLKSGGKGAGKSKTKATSHTATSTVMQFKITLKGIQPPIWRRIQVEDCTLHDLHSHIQDAMGWTNSHRHQFMIQGLSYSPPNPFANGEWDIDSENSAGIMLSDIVPATGKRFRFQYEYDFGDSWNHEILFEGFRTKDPAVRYPQCLDGARACPPEDCGGVWGYMGLLSALDDPKHARHDDMSEWVGPIDPEEFDAETVTAIMQNGD